jgi:hypothetical protein
MAKKDKRSAVSTARIIKLYKQHKSIAKVGRIVKRHLTSVRARLIRANVIEGSFGE